MHLILRVVGNFWKNIGTTSARLVGVHESNVFVDFVWFDVMRVDFVDVFSPCEDFGVGLLHFALQFLTLFRAIQEGFDKGWSVIRGRLQSRWNNRECACRR
jgi:hypothetical protein